MRIEFSSEISRDENWNHYGRYSTTEYMYRPSEFAPSIELESCECEHYQFVVNSAPLNLIAKTANEGQV